MPLGFANSILTASSTTTTTNAFKDYDGSNDVTFTRNAAVVGFLGFAPFNDEYGVSLHIDDGGSGSTNDEVRYDVIRNNSGTLSITSQNQDFRPTSTPNYTNFRANIVPTNGGNIYGFAPTGVGLVDARIFSISGATVTCHTAFNSAQDQGDGGRLFRRPGTDEYVHMKSRSAAVMTLTDNGDSSSSTIGADTSIASSDMFYDNKRAINGFKDANTGLMWKTIEDSPSTNINSIVPFEIDLTTTGTQSVTAISGVSAVALNLNTSVSNVIDFGQAGSNPFQTTDFNNTLMFWERKGTDPGAIRVHHYTSGDSSITTSNTINFSHADGDISPTGCFVGANNDVFLFAMLATTTKLIIMKFVKSTNTLSTITTITETFNVEKCRMSRWGDDAALLQYNDTKMRLLLP